METFSALLALCAGNSPVTGELPSQRPLTRSFDVFLPKQTVGQTIEAPVIWDAIALIMTSLSCRLTCTPTLPCINLDTYIVRVIFFYKFRVFRTRIWNVNRTILGCIPSLGAFSKWRPWKNAEKPTTGISMSQIMRTTDTWNTSLNVCFSWWI